MEMLGTEKNFVQGKTMPVLISCVSRGVKRPMVKLEFLADKE